MGTNNKAKINLPDADWANWVALVNRGKILRRNEKSGAIELDRGKGGRYAMSKRARGDAMEETPGNVKRWILARHSGMNVKRAGEVSGATWGEIRAAYLGCEECRCAYDAMHEASRSMMKELAYSSYEDALKGEDVTKSQMRAAEDVLGAMEVEHFGTPKERGGLMVGDGRVVGGGITIQLVDVSKGYRPPAIANDGDGDEGVLV